MKMDWHKYVVLFVVVFCTTLTSAQKVYYDTLHLSITEPDSVDLARPGDYFQCIDLAANRYIISVDGKKFICKDSSALSEVIKSNKQAIAARKLNIIVSAKTDPEKMIAVLFLLENNQVPAYSVLSADGALGNPDPIIVESKHPFLRDLDSKDLDILAIKVIKDSMEIRFKGKVSTIPVKSLAQFLAKNKKQIDPHKIILSAPATARYADIGELMKILTDNGFYDVHYKVYE